MITTERLTLEDFTLNDAFEIEQWGKHTDERLIDYNLSDLDDFEIKMWYRQKRIGGICGAETIRQVHQNGVFGYCFGSK